MLLLPNEEECRKCREFDVKGVSAYGRVISVHDGDTVNVALLDCLGQRGMCKFKIRLAGIDACEVKPLKSANERELHKRCGIMTRDLVSRMTENKIVRVSFEDFDKYGGRFVGRVFVLDQPPEKTSHGENVDDVSRVLLRMKVVHEFDGKRTKGTFTKEELEKIEQTLVLLQNNQNNKNCQDSQRLLKTRKDS